MIRNLNTKKIPYQVSGGGFDPDAGLYITNSGITDTTIQTAIDSFFIDLKNASLYTKIKAGWLHAGDNFDKQKLNIKNPLDTDAAFRLTIITSGVNDVNGSTSVVDTNFVLKNELDISSVGATVTSGAGFGGGFLCFGGYDTGGRFTFLMTTGSVLAFRITAQVSTSNSESKGVYTFQKISSANGNVWKNGTKVVADTSISGTLPDGSAFLNGANVNGTLAFTDNKRLQTCLIHEGLTDTETTNLYTIINTFETALGRKTW
jgi:hypothetical protein